MPRRKLIFAPGEYYHLYNRGVNRDRIYFTRDNYLHFLRKLREYFFDEPSVRRPDNCTLDSVDATSPGRADHVLRPVQVISYCLMPNHYHLLVQLHCNDLSDRMQSLSQAYTNAINKSLRRVGPLFQGRFQAKHVEREEYLIHVSRYIHLNAVVARMVQGPADWEFSSYRDIVGLRDSTSPNRRPIPEPEPLFKTFSTVEQYREFVEGGGPALPDRMRHLALDE
jgi:putative transposase